MKYSIASRTLYSLHENMVPCLNSISVVLTSFFCFLSQFVYSNQTKFKKDVFPVQRLIVFSFIGHQKLFEPNSFFSASTRTPIAQSAFVSSKTWNLFFWFYRLKIIIHKVIWWLTVFWVRKGMVGSTNVFMYSTAHRLFTCLDLAIEIFFLPVSSEIYTIFFWPMVWF